MNEDAAAQLPLDSGTFFMKWWILSIALVSTVSVAAAPPGQRAAGLMPAEIDTSAGAGIAPQWHTNYQEAKQLARRLDKPLFAVFR